MTAERDIKRRAALGFTVKSGWASVVLLSGPAAAPRVLECRRLELSDPAIPESRQPYHAGFGTARDSGRELARLVASVERFGSQSVTRLLGQYQAAGGQLHGAGVVVGSLADPERLANAHIRIHALEGRLFRGVIEKTVAGSGSTCSVWRERDLYGVAAAALERPESEVRAVVAALGETVAGSWRAEQKAAALAAWLVLADVPGAPTGRRPEAGAR